MPSGHSSGRSIRAGVDNVEIDSPGAQEGQRILELVSCVWAFSALSAALESGLLEGLDTPQTGAQISARTGIADELIKAVLEVLSALGLVTGGADGYACTPGMVGYLSRRHPDVVRADLRASRLLAGELTALLRPGHCAPPGWHYSDPELLQAQGVRSTESVAVWASRLFPTLAGLSEALAAPTARFLDVGTGVGRLAIAMCHQFPALHIVGLDLFKPALDLARRNVARAALSSRIDLRLQGVQELSEDSCYDLAWVPVMFLPPDVAASGLHRVHRALRPGGWVVLGLLAAEGEGLRPAVLRLMGLLLGGGAWSAHQAAELLWAAGYERVRVLPAIPDVPIQMIVGRRPAD